MAINLDYINIISQNEVMADLFNALMYKNFTSFIIEHSVYDYNYKPYFAAINVYPHYLPFFETLEQILTIPTSLTKNLQITPVTCDVLSTSIFQLDSNISNLWVYNN
jgi:hypothetical protein